jgi:RNA-directed DNA polymerase
MNGHGQSDRSVVPASPPDKAARAAAEAGEERERTVGNTAGETRPGRSAGPGVSSDLGRVRQVARRDKDARFTALLHHVSLPRLMLAFEDLNPRAAPGVDGVTWQEYEQDLVANLRDLHGRVQSGRYRASPSRRVYIPKADGRQRPLGIASLEDKIVQRAVVEVLNAVYEADFAGFSYGFRPGRSPHQALDALAAGIYRTRVSWVLDADIRDFFSSLDRDWLGRFLRHRIADERVLRLIGKWLAAGVIEDGQWSETGQGSPQGASASPLLANVYLHYVLDLWADWWRKRHARGEVIIVRFADDFIIGFEYQDDAERFLEGLRERFAKFSLELHPDKTRLIEFGRHAARRRAARGEGKPETFAFLGFTHICATTRSGRFWIRRKTDTKRLRAKLKQAKAEIMRRRHLPVPEQGRWLASVVTGHQAYYAVPGNYDAVHAFRNQVTRHWHHALRRRSQKSRLTWARMNRLVTRWLPRTRIVHPFPEQRFAASHPW